MKLFGRQKQHPELQRQSSDESCHSSTALPSKCKTHRRAPSFTFHEWSPMGGRQGSGSSDASVKSSRSNYTDPLDVSWSSSCSGALSQVDMVMDRWLPESKSKSEERDGGSVDHVEHKRSSCPLEIIRLLSFSPTKKRADTADTASSSSSSDTAHEDSTRMGLLVLQQLEDLRRGSPSPLLGLQYLPEELTVG